MSRPARVLSVEPLGEHACAPTFSDGLVRELDFAGVVQGRGGVFEPPTDPELFARATVDPVAGTIAWPSGVDLDADVLPGDHDPAGRPCHVVTAVSVPVTAL
jgi:hypothetical protein